MYPARTVVRAFGGVAVAIVGVALAVNHTTGRGEATAEAPIPIVIGVVPDSAAFQAGQSPSDALASLKGHWPGRVVEARIVDAPTADARDARGWFEATVAADSESDGGAIPAIWEADLLEGAVADLAAKGASDLADVISGATINVRTPSGKIVLGGGGMGDIAPGQTFGPVTDAAGLATELRGSLEPYGITDVSVEVENVLESAPRVVATVSDPKVAVGHSFDIVSAIVGKPRRFEGYYLELRDVDGNVIFRNSAAFRTGAGRLWVRPDLDGLGSIVHTGFGRPASELQANG
mgnify:CR=1 FL=1